MAKTMTVRLHEETFQALEAQMGARESFDQVITRLLGEVREARGRRRRRGVKGPDPEVQRFMSEAGRQALFPETKAPAGPL